MLKYFCCVCLCINYSCTVTCKLCGLSCQIVAGMAKSQDLEDNELLSVARRLTTVEMKELNERQRAEHASQMYEQQKTLFRQLEDRNFELEHKFAEVGTVCVFLLFCCIFI